MAVGNTVLRTAAPGVMTPDKAFLFLKQKGADAVGKKQIPRYARDGKLQRGVFSPG
jgi:hypothetical protein